MLPPTEIRRVILVVMDGLRPDAVEAFGLNNVRRLAQLGASTMRARTVLPSCTWPSITSLMTGVAPEKHGILADSIHLPRPKMKLAPLPDVLQRARAGYRSSAFIGDIPALYRGIASRIATGLGFAEARFAGRSASEVLMAARSALSTQRRGLIFFHFAEADSTGHDHGWMSPEYGEAARRIDHALALLAEMEEIEHDTNTLLIALADHGGGGLDPKDHDGWHPLNETIPVLLVGGAVRNCSLGETSLLDVPATIAWTLGVDIPTEYTGRVLREAFVAAPESAVA